MKCLLCGQRKGKRFCPAKNALICASCCGTKRIVEIDCPSNCVYLREGQGHEARQKYNRQFQTLDPGQQRLLLQVGEQFPDVLLSLEAVLAAAARSRRYLSDQNALQAVAVLLQDYETENKGVLYERKAGSLDAQTLVDALREEIEKRRSNFEPGVRHLDVAGVLGCLTVIRLDIDYHLAQKTSHSYLEFLMRSYPDAGRGQPPSQSRLILP